MARRSKLDPLRDQILEWSRQGKDARSISRLLEERGVKSSFQNVSSYLKKALEPIRDKLDKKAQTEYIVDFERGKALLDRLIQEAMDIDSDGMSLPQRNAFRSKLEAIREKLKILGAYPTPAPNITQVGIAVQIDKAAFVDEFVRSLPDDLRQRVLAFLRQ